jgi:hypothetical protein
VASSCPLGHALNAVDHSIRKRGPLLWTVDDCTPFGCDSLANGMRPALALHGGASVVNVVKVIGEKLSAGRGARASPWNLVYVRLRCVRGEPAWGIPQDIVQSA